MLQHYFCARNKSLILTFKWQLRVSVTNGKVVPLFLVITSFSVLTSVTVQCVDIRNESKEGDKTTLKTYLWQPASRNWKVNSFKANW